MLIEQFYNEITIGDNSAITFTREQASKFAKQVADDFNPLHNADAKRFCVPGDLLFSMVLSKYGVSQHMHFTFAGMVTDGVKLLLPAATSRLEINGDNNKNYLNIERSGETSENSELINSLTQSYVAFSGQTFPHVLVPLLQQQGVMINPDRPMVMYESMLIDLQRLDLVDINLELDPGSTRFETSGKRGNVCLAFNLIASGQTIGRGEKHMLVSGLQPFEQSQVDRIITDYSHWKQNYKVQ